MQEGAQSGVVTDVGGTDGGGEVSKETDVAGMGEGSD